MTEPKLLNPTDDMPTHLAFEDWPHPREFLRGGGMPGVEYLFVLPEEQPRAQQDPTGKWASIMGMPFFTVRGVHLTMVARGKPISGARPGSSVCKFQRSKEAVRRIESVVPVAPEASISTAAASAVASAATGNNPTQALKLPKSLES